MKTKLRIATRESRLALRQAEIVKQQLQQHHPELTIELIGMTTQGDKELSQSLAKIGGKGLFIKELEQALLTNRADLAVHSMKDMPPDLTPGLTIAAICEREPAWDVFISKRYQHLQTLPAGAVIGTSSLRRQCQLYALLPNIQIKLLRGNLDTRLRKLDAGEYDAIILAAAGLLRLNLKDRIRQMLMPPEFIPAVGQGAIGIQTRIDDRQVNQLIKPLNHFATAVCVSAERALTQRLQGSCQTPIAGYAHIQANMLNLTGLVGQPDGSIIYKSTRQADINDPPQLGIAVADDLLVQGAQAILDSLRGDV